MPAAAPTRRRGATPLPLRLLLVIGFLLGAVAIVVVVLFGNERWAMPVAVLAALWAALLAAIALEWFRREAQLVSARESEIARTYELELLREVTARREFETALVDKVREGVESRHSEDLQALREQIERLTSALSNLMDGDVLVERLTLSAESTRVRGLAGGGRGRLSGLNRAELTRDGFRPGTDPAGGEDAPGGQDAAGGQDTDGGQVSAGDQVTVDADLFAGAPEHGAEQAAVHAEPQAIHSAGRATTPSVGRDPDDVPDAAAAASVAGHGEPAQVTVSAAATVPTPPRPDAPSTLGARRHRQDAVRPSARTPTPPVRGHELDPDAGAESVAVARIPVSQLLAAFGASAGPKPGGHRRRRRAED